MISIVAPMTGGDGEAGDGGGAEVAAHRVDRVLDHALAHIDGQSAHVRADPVGHRWEVRENVVEQHQADEDAECRPKDRGQCPRKRAWPRT